MFHDNYLKWQGFKPPDKLASIVDAYTMRRIWVLLGVFAHKGWIQGINHVKVIKLRDFWPK